MSNLAINSFELKDLTKPKFRVNEKIRPELDSVFLYEVLKTPETCVHNDQPSYLLQCLNQAVKTPPFYRDQATIEQSWFSADGPRFLYAVGSHVRHKKTGGIYEVKIGPDEGRLEATGAPAYSYRDINGGPIWHRHYSEMEDGRFEPVLLGTDPINH